MRRRTLSIHCQHCGTQVLSYIKIGKGRLIRCWKNRIIINDTIKNDTQVYCPCGQFIGTDKKHFILLKKHAVKIRN